MTETGRPAIAHTMDIYRDATARSASRVQHSWLEMLDRTLQKSAHNPQDLLRWNNMVELAEVQSGLYLDPIRHAVDTSNRLLDIAGRTARDAVRPLQANLH